MPPSTSSSWNTYTVLRLLHGHWRWAALATALWLLARAVDGAARGRPWKPGDERAAVVFLSALDLQLLLGLILYFGFSPFFTALRQAPHAALADRATRFFAVEHQTAMLLAVVAAHVGRIRARRLPDVSPRRHRVMLATLALFFALVLWAIPWPGRAVARPLFRLFP
jgi:hypothetical protein